MKKLKRRAGEWVKKFHAVIELPNRPERITKKDIERIKQIKWKNLAEAEKKQMRREYEYRYENKMPDIYVPKPPYHPNTEKEFYDNPDYGTDYDNEWEEQHPDWDSDDEDGYEDVVDSRALIEQWINDVIGTVTLDHEIPGVRDQVMSLIEDAARANDYSMDFYNYLEENADTINSLAEKAMHGYKKRNGETVHEENGGENALPALMTVLNYGKPLDMYQSAEYTETGHITFDTTDL